MDREAIHRLAELWDSEVSKDRPQEVEMQCPFAPFSSAHTHDIDRNPNFSIRIADNLSVCYCFACGNGGLVRKIAKQLCAKSDNPKYREAYRFVKKEENGTYIPSQAESQPKLKIDSSLQRLLRAARGKISDILRARGITDADIAKWTLGYDIVEKRDLFPVFDYKNRLVAVSGRRVFAEQPAKYYHYGKSPLILTKVFYGEHFLDPTHDSCILVEGPTDTIKVSRMYPNVFGQCGAQVLTTSRLKRLKHWFSTVTLLFDTDKAGIAAMFEIGLILSKYLTVFVAFLPEGMDPFDCSAREIQQAIEQRVLWSLVDWQQKGVKF